MVTTAGAELPPGPVQITLYGFEPAELNGPTMMLPDVLLPVLKLPLQVSASVEPQVSVEDSPSKIVFGLAESEAVGVGGGITVTVADCEALPPGPLHSSAKVSSEYSGSVRPLPDRVPLLDQGPDAVHLVAFVELHVRVERLPE
jgi:hypothetical protein